MTTSKNDRRFIQIGLKVSYYRKLRGMTQEELAEKVDLNARYLSRVESPKFVQPISLKTLFAIADACRVSPHCFLLFDEE